jgi:alpha-N-arabinofuranosidase
VQRWDSPDIRDDFDEPTPRLEWNYLRNPDFAQYSLTARHGWLRLHAAPITLDMMASPTLIGRRQRHLTCTMTTLLDASHLGDTEEAGLVVWMNERHHYEIPVRNDYGRYVLFVRRRIGQLRAEIAQIASETPILQLRIEAQPTHYRFAWSSDGTNFQLLATGESRYLSTEVAGGFTGIYLALYAIGFGRGYY